MRQGKAQFRAMRERVGLSTKTLADLLGSTVDTVEEWETPEHGDPPEDAVHLLVSLLERHVETVSAAVDAIEHMRDAHGNEPQGITLPYYRSQAHYDQYVRDSGDYSIVNAQSRDIAAILENEGYEIRFTYPEDHDEFERNRQ